MISGVPLGLPLYLECLVLMPHFSVLLVALPSTKSFQSAMLPYATVFPPKVFVSSP